MSKDVTAGFKLGLNQVEFMLKRFIDDHAIERIEKIKQGQSDPVTLLHLDPLLREKMDTLAWLARSVELVSTPLVHDMIRQFKRQVSQPEQKHLRESYIKSYHGSNAVTVIINRMNQVMQLEQIEDIDDGTMQKFTLLLMILEPIVVNEENALRSVKEGLMQILARTLSLQDPFFAGLMNTIDGRA